MSDDALWIADDRALARLVTTLASEPRYALDTEFHRERTYHPKLALLQLAWPGGIALVDPLALDVRGVTPLFEAGGEAVVHAAQQDLDVLTRTVGAVPCRLFDTQLAAGFLGHATPSLGNLLAGELGVKVPKGDRLTDWLRRPLSSGQRSYAATDVAYLLELRERLVAALEKRGRLPWALDECEELRHRPTGAGNPDDAWLKLKDVRTLRGRSRGVAQAVAGWRERRAAALDLPVRFVLSDLAVLGIAQRPPTSLDELRVTRGVEDRHTRGTTGAEILAAVADGLAKPVALPEPNGELLERSLRPAVTLVSAWVSQLARDQEIDTSLLATRADLVELLRLDPDARLAHGWRAEMVGDDVRHLVEGRAALAFDGKGGLKLLTLD